MSASRTYGQFCGVSRAADLLGQRWALHIVRDLLIAPARFSDLLRALPGVPTNMLSTRLRELEAAGVVERQAVPGQRSVQYRLTARGRGLEPVIDALGRWGAGRMVAPEPGETVTSAIVASMLRTAFAGRAEPGPTTTTVFQVGGGPVAAWAEVTGEDIVVGDGEHTRPDLLIVAGPAMRAFLAGELTPTEFAAAPGVTVTGPVPLLELFSRLFRLPFDLALEEQRNEKQR
ncbi:winged helix-turn-helix transcriptional regulator [Amorphoplanes nipponensis]|uniref:HxlR family transcriptional regulator n=1 Tax=Actinoplanes nipponensis TaxID=135950 RepID=A0A919JDY4_9ACTN|nr:helix-turn-helix domain-containing protein [Actinoplanes nipponensis]GIE48671.1 HxlR family transcriptional regulator [Actinoplanes nipponensis]